MALPTSRTYPRPVSVQAVSRDVEEMIAFLAQGGASSVTELWYFAGDMQPMSGSPGQSSVGNLGVVPAWGMQKAAVTTLGIVASLPPSWVTYSVTAIGAPRDVSGGDVAMRVAHVNGGVGDNLTTGVVTGAVSTAAVGSTAGVLRSVTLASGLAAPSVGAVAGMQVARRVAEAADTYAGAFDLVAVVLRKVT